MPLSRRRFMRETALAAGGLALAGTARAEKDIPMNTARPLFISTWPFGKAANEQSLRIAEQGGSVLDAVERGIHVAEADASNPSVGLGGIPNARGVVQLDACIMDGEGQRAGSVAAIEGILHPISVARRVMDETKHVMLAGEGARQFALEQGFASVELLTEERRKAWEEWRESRARPTITTPSPCLASTVRGGSLAAARPAAGATSCRAASATRRSLVAAYTSMGAWARLELLV